MKKLALVLTTTKPEEEELELETWLKDDFLCKNFIHNGLSDDLYDYYNSVKRQKKFGMLFRRNLIQKKLDSRNMLLATILSIK